MLNPAARNPILAALPPIASYRWFMVWRALFNTNITRDALGVARAFDCPGGLPDDEGRAVAHYRSQFTTPEAPDGLVLFSVSVGREMVAAPPVLEWRLLPKNTRSKTGGPRGHRVQIKCPCGRWIGAGKLPQHACKAVS